MKLLVRVRRVRAVNSGDGGRRRQGDLLLDFLPELELWHSPDREAFVTVSVGGHVENWRVRSDEFSGWLSERCFQATGAAPSSQALKDALRVVEARAKYAGPEYPVFLRLGEHDGAVYVDLGDARWRTIEVTPSG